MALPTEVNYKLEYTRYRHYFHQIWTIYQKPAIKVSSALLLTVFTIIFFAAFAIRPTLVTVAELVKKIDDQQKVLNQMKEKSAALASAQTEYQAAAPQIPQLNSAIPQSENLPQLITLFEATSAFHQIPLSSLTLGDITYAGTNVPHLSGPQTRDISLSVTSDYANLKTYLSNLIRLPRLVSIEALSFAKPTNSNQSGEASDMQINISLKSYFLPRDDTVSP